MYICAPQNCLIEASVGFRPPRQLLGVAKSTDTLAGTAGRWVKSAAWGTGLKVP